MNSEFGISNLKYFTDQHFGIWNNLHAWFWYGISDSESFSHAVCRSTQTLKSRHYCFVHIINVKCFTENITKVRIVGSYRFFREKNLKYELRHNNFIYSRNRNLNCGIRNSESQISNILLISILKFGIIYRLDFGPISKYANLVLQSPL